MESILLSREQSRAVDNYAVQRLGVPSLVLMENAGRGVAGVLQEVGATGPVAVLCGKGNNAGDGFVVARHLAIRGLPCRVVLTSPASDLRGDAEINFRILQKLGSDIADLSSSNELAADLSRIAAGATWLVDALLGTGAKGAPRSPVDQAVRWMNAQPAKRLAIDIPSGLDCDTGQAADPCVVADVTCTFFTPKTGYAQEAARRVLGELRVVDIGIPAEIAHRVVADSGV